MSLGHGVLSDYLQESGSFSFAQDSSREIKLGGEVPRLPLFSRCPITNQARLEDPRVSMLYSGLPYAPTGIGMG